jgi:hypothetical protein
VDRARFLITLVAVAAVVAACTSRDHGVTPSTSTVPPASSSGPGSGPEAGAALRVAVAEEPASLNPFDARSRTLAGAAVLTTVLPQLFAVDPGGKVHGSLVETGTESEGGLRVDLSLRRGVRWSDGTPITAADLQFTLDVIRSDAWRGPRADYADISAIEGSGRDVVVRLRDRLPGWQRLFSGLDFVLPAHRLRGADLKVVWPNGPDVSGGPLMIAGRTPGLSVDLAPNPQWWGSHAAPRVTLLFVPDGRTMEQLLVRGELDVVFPPAVTNRAIRFRALRDVTVDLAPAGGDVVALVANTEKVSAERRQALLGLVDRDRFVAALLAGEADPVTAWPVEARDGAWPSAAAVAHSDAPVVRRGFTARLVAANEQPLAGVLGRSMQTRVLGTPTQIDLAFTDGSIVNGEWLRDGAFDVALAETVAWPAPCWRCVVGGDAIGRGNAVRVGGLDALAAAADHGDASAPAAIDRRLRDDADVLPLWRPRALVASRGMRGVAANSWAPGPLWNVDGWRR